METKPHVTQRAAATYRAPRYCGRFPNSVAAKTIKSVTVGTEHIIIKRGFTDIVRNKMERDTHIVTVALPLLLTGFNRVNKN